MIKLTTRQQQVLDLIKSSIEETGFPPTRAELATTLGFKSPNAAEEHIKALARKGAIEILPGASRGIKIVEKDKGLPIVGSVAAGSPILATEHIDEYLNLPGNMFYPSADYLLRVQGMSMKDIGIYEDDLIGVHKTDRIRNGDIVIARIDEDVTVKRYERKGNVIYLHPENEEFNVIEVDTTSCHFEVEGVYVGVIRRQV
ncbi:transcriptional repressor LexA [Marinicellulosiphila megalodicopiae]|uniref:transcriptional repressor LexA n=1 Tax=Marinicellulosiphila megalodicopiae TaxID=2724896 RepID=UPI003BB05BA6